ncbi:hypothetical protein Agub_g2057 [Astrephomene gubernaculifera]|uniref:Uncharacterized protein n=1 Tax=Astrephomene gubernaculifera TaxID=47775 RepID=A0AAD3HHD2_9CHLO|nr:hypothetical protein Agub_g2057 [Astrephomene gubernaculifera]
MAALKPSPVKAAASAQEIAQLRSQVTSLTHELGVVTQRCGLLGRLITGESTSVTAEDVLLSGEEVQEAALRAIWLAHYWGLARDLGILPELATAQAERWSRAAPPVEVLYTAAADVARRVREQTQGSSSSQTAAATATSTAASSTR